jgi:hypothetical protein
MTKPAKNFRVWIKWTCLSGLALLFLTGARPALGQDNWDVYRNATKDAATYNRNKVLPLYH